MPMRLAICRQHAARGLISALFLLACAACQMAGLPRGESVAAARSASPVLARHVADSAMLRVDGRHFVSPDGRVVLLRGVNLGGDGKLPPFPTPDDPVLLDRLTELGFNAIRLPFTWEAYEPEPGRYDEDYLARVVAVAAAAWTRGLYVIIDIHQDGFARTLCYGCGAGFPLWAVSPRATPRPPHNGCGCKRWPLLELLDPGVYRSFADFYADTYGVRTRYLAMLERVAGVFAAVPGVVGYDPLNEPWGDERREIAPLYRDAAAALRRAPDGHPFPRGTGANCHWLPDLAAAPGSGQHRVRTALLQAPGNRARGRGRADRRHRSGLRPDEGEGGGMGRAATGRRVRHPGRRRRAGDYVDYHYDHLDAALASGMQWTVSSRQMHQDGEGWNGEDFNILDAAGRPRRNYRPRPYPHRVAGVPLCFRFEATAPPRGGPRLEFVWAHRPGLGPTEIIVPEGLFPPGSRARAEPGDATCLWDHSRRLLTCDAPRPAKIRVVLESP